MVTTCPSLLRLACLPSALCCISVITMHPYAVALLPVLGDDRVAPDCLLPDPIHDRMTADAILAPVPTLPEPQSTQYPARRVNRYGPLLQECQPVTMRYSSESRSIPQSVLWSVHADAPQCNR